MTQTRADVRRRQGMWVGGTSSVGIFHLSLEVLGNAVDLVLAGRAAQVDVTCHGDGSVEVADDGPGFDMANRTVREFFEHHHDGPTADGHVPHIHLVDYGVGLFVVNALSERVVVRSAHEGVRHHFEWQRGGDELVVAESGNDSSAASGSSVRFWPDTRIFGDSRIQPDRVHSRLVELDLLIPDLRTSFDGHRSVGEAESGLSTLMVERLGVRSEHWLQTSSVVGDDGASVEVDVALAASGSSSDERMLLYCNFREVTEESAIHREIRQTLRGVDSGPIVGLCVVVNMRMLMPQFSGPTKGRLDDPVAVNAAAITLKELLAANADARLAMESLNR